MIANWLFFAAVLLALCSFCLAMARLRPGVTAVLFLVFLVAIPVSLGLVASVASQFGTLF